MEIHKKEKTKSNPVHDGEALECNRNFYTAAKVLGIDPLFVHTDKDWSEISAVQVPILLPSLSASCIVKMMIFRSQNERRSPSGGCMGSSRRRGLTEKSCEGVQSA